MNEGAWRLLVAGSARRDLERVAEKYATAIVELLPGIAANPHRLGKPLRFELEGRWVARRGPYRIVYALDEGARTVTVLAVAHRADVYRRRPVFLPPVRRLFCLSILIAIVFLL